MTSSNRADVIARLRSEESPTVIGAGAIGSWVCRWLSANGVPFVVYDDDRVALKNIAAGAFAQTDVGTHKVTCLMPGRYPERWRQGDIVGTAILVCADHGPTRREAAIVARDVPVPFVCAKANGDQWQVWHVAIDGSPADFIAFDNAAELDPVTVACGDPSVGRVASLGAAAELLSVWTGLDVTPAEIEASYGVSFDPALARALAEHWNRTRMDAEKLAADAAAERYQASISEQRDISDDIAMRELARLRKERAQRRRVKRSTIHQQATVELDVSTNPTQETMREIARAVVGTRRASLQYLKQAESRIAARALETDLSIPDTISVSELFA